MKFSITWPCIAILFSACSQLNAPEGTDIDADLDSEPVIVTINTQLSDGMKARSDAENQENANISRYVLETYVVDDFNRETLDATETNDTGNFTHKLDRKKKYKFYCWADEGDKSTYDLSKGLTKIDVIGDGTPTIAHRGKSEIVSGNDAGATVNIKTTHAVAKLVLMTTKPLHAEAVTVSVESFTTCNAISGNERNSSSAIIESNVGPTEDITDATVDAPKEVLSMYIFMGLSGATSVTLKNHANPDASRTISLVPFSADCRTVIKGDVTSINKYTITLNPSLDSGWTIQ